MAAVERAEREDESRAEVRVLACTSCFEALLRLGAKKSGPRVGSLLDRCQVHPPGVEPPQAMNLAISTGAQVDAWRETQPRPVPSVAAVHELDRDVVCLMAANLLSGHLQATKADIWHAVNVAREVLRNVKGESS